MRKVKVGIVGCGNISGIYFSNLIHLFKNTEVAACADLDAKKAQAASEEWKVPVRTLEEMLSDPEIEIILNITTPQGHYGICKKALLAGKHVYVEKPLSLTIEEGMELVQLAAQKGLMLGGAPDTFLGGGIQTCRKLIDDGYIGEPIAATAFMVCHGHEGWHPNPEFYYQKGGGPMFDMGPYYLTALVNLLGPVETVCGMNRISFPQRTITSEARFGQTFDVEVPTHVTGNLRMKSGAITSIITSFDIWHSTLPRIEIYGTRGSMLVPDPNSFGGPVSVGTLDGTSFHEMPLTHGYTENSRGIGVSDMAQCILDGGQNRASGALTCHVLEIMCALHISDEQGVYYQMKTQCDRPAPLAANLVKGYVK